VLVGTTHLSKDLRGLAERTKEQKTQTMNLEKGSKLDANTGVMLVGFVIDRFHTGQYLSVMF